MISEEVDLRRLLDAATRAVRSNEPRLSRMLPQVLALTAFFISANLSHLSYLVCKFDGTEA